MGCCLTINQGYVGIKERFGKYIGNETPGIIFLWPCCDEVRPINIKIQPLDVYINTKTQDNVFIGLNINVQFRVQDPKKAQYELSDPHNQIQSYVLDQVRAVVPTMTIDDIYINKSLIASVVFKNLGQQMNNFGYEIMQVLVSDIQPNKQVEDSMNQAETMKRLRIAAVDKAEAEKIKQIKAAEAEAESKYLSGCGIARQRKAIIDGLREGVQGFQSDVQVNPREVIDMMLITQYLDTMKDIGLASRSNAIFLPHEPGNLQSLGNQMRNGILQAQKK